MNDVKWTVLLFRPIHRCLLHTDLNLMDWGRLNVLAVALSAYVYLWDAEMGQIVLLKKMEEENGYISSLSWSKDGNFLAIGTSECKVEVKKPDKHLFKKIKRGVESVLISRVSSWLLVLLG